jgi:HlyD family secretion protein
VTAAIAIAVTAAVLALRHRPVKVTVAAARRGDLLVSVLCDGNLEPPAGGELRAREGGTVAALAVHDGQRVEGGQLLLRLDNPDLAAQARQAHADLDRMEAERSAAASALAGAEQEASYRQQVLAGDRRLLAENALAPAAVRADELAALQAAAAVAKARAELASVAGAGGAGSSGAAGGGASRLDLARRGAAAADRRLADLTVRAPAAGVVYGLPRTLGEAVEAGRLVATVTDTAHPHLRFRVDQPDLPRVVPGQLLIVTFNGQPDRQWRGTVRSVGTGLREAGGRQVGEALADLAEPADTLPANAAVDVQVIIARREGVLIVPRVALHRDGEERWVFTIADASAERRRVEVGAIGLSEVEVARGLAAGEEVIVEAPVTLGEGTRVVARKP